MLPEELCRFIETEVKDHYKCERCGFTCFSTTPNIKKPCPSHVPENEDQAKRVQKLPGAHKMAWNLAKSLAAFVADGMKFVSLEVYEERLKTCDTCEFRQINSNRCLKCGCYLSLKAKGRAFQCPEKKWLR